MYTKKLLFVFFLLVVALSDLTFLEQVDNNRRLKIAFEFTRPCFKNFSEGECAGLNPPATACVWKPHATNGWCSHKPNPVTYSNLFVLA
jgi:hypothetical protein